MHMDVNGINLTGHERCIIIYCAIESYHMTQLLESTENASCNNQKYIGNESYIEIECLCTKHKLSMKKIQSMGC